MLSKVSGDLSVAVGAGDTGSIIGGYASASPEVVTVVGANAMLSPEVTTFSVGASATDAATSG